MTSEEHKRENGIFLLSLLMLLKCDFNIFNNNTHGDPTSLAPHERLTDLAVVPREKPHTGAAARDESCTVKKAER